MSLKKALLRLQQNTDARGKLISKFVLKEKDTNAGLGFEEDLREIWVTNDSWLIKEFKESTIQPDYGQTITKTTNERAVSYDVDGFLNYLTHGEFEIKDASQFLSDITRELHPID